MQRFHLRQPVHTSIAAIDLIAESSDLSRQQIKRAMSKGCVWLTQGKQTRRIRRATKQLSANTILDMYYDEAVLLQQPEAPGLIADHSEYSVWHKPSGMLSQGSKWGDHCTVTRWAEVNLLPQRNSFLVHRLDRAASGLILIAHTKRTAAALANLFESRQIKKIYQAQVEGNWPYRVNHRIETLIDGRKAISSVSPIRRTALGTLLEINIETGRKHQIRRHLAEAGYPIIGDRLYGNQHQSNLNLCSVRLAFACPLSQSPVEFTTQVDFALR